jgi:RES domain-containing protein
MLVYRISSRNYVRDLSGTGAGLYGGRWNPVGIRLLYTTGSISLACLEYLAHNFHVLASQDICLAKIRINQHSVETLTTRDLPEGWNEKSYLPASTQKIGADFATRAQAYLIKVPSAIVPDEYNFLLNPLHPHHEYTVIEKLIDPFVLDGRLFGK